jgi:hypothetical protein
MQLTNQTAAFTDQSLHRPISRAGLLAAVAALVLGVLADVLLRGWPWGLNVTLFTLALVGAVFVAARGGNVALKGGGRWLALPAVLFAAAYAWRDSSALFFMDFLMLLIVLALFASRSRAGRLRIAGLIDYALALIVSGLYAAFGAFALLFQDIPWRGVRKGAQPTRWLPAVARVGCGALLAAPLLLIFGLLFVSADAGFAQLARDLFRWNLRDVLDHLLVITLLAWIAAGFLRIALLTAPSHTAVVDVAPVRLGIVETATALGLLNLLFLAFVVLQFRYLFGLGSVTALGYAEYARRGFFELTAVAALVLPLLLVAHWLQHKDNPAHARVFAALAGLLIALLFAIMASALQRMALYVSEYGLTELRVYTTAFMGWLALVFVWFAATVLRGRREQFAFGALVAAMAVAMGLIALNPDDLIARINLGRAVATSTQQPAPKTDERRGRELDADYLISLSADALPAVMEALPNLPEPQRCRTAARILARWTPPESVDWRTWNWSRAQAWQLVGARLDELKEMECPIRDSMD